MERDRERQLVRQAQAGDRQAYETLARAYQRSLLLNLSRLLYDPEEAQDIAQEALFSAWQSLHRFDCERPFWPWLRQIALNLARKRLRFLGRHPHQQLAEEPNTTETEQDQQDADLLSSLRRCLAELTTTQRELLAQRFQHGRAVTAIATDLGLSQSGVSMRLGRLRDILRRCVQGTVSS